MSKLWLIIQREYLVRVKKKMFIVTTLLTPIGIGVLGLVAGFLASQGSQSFNKVLIKDESAMLVNRIEDSPTLDFEFSDEDITTLKENYADQGFDILLYFKVGAEHEPEALFFAKEKLGIAIIQRIESRLSSAVKEYKIDASGIDREVFESFRTDISLENGAINDVASANSSENSSKLSILIGTGLGGLMAFMMYMVIFIYGSMVMRSVMEEKINRIVEVMISSVKPFHLMLGKVLGVGAVGLTQLAIWIILIPLVLIGVQFAIGGNVGAGQMAEISEQMNSIPKEALEEVNISAIINEFMGQNWGMIIPVFIIYFFGGYFIYSSLFAAIGSAVGDDMGESQQLMMPLTVPVIIALFMAQAVITNPNSSMATFGSMFPLFSPIIMPVRLAFNPPLWEIVLSIVILILSCIFFAWIAGRIYRVGILMYGKKVTFRELGKWLFYKG